MRAAKVIYKDNINVVIGGKKKASLLRLAKFVVTLVLIMIVRKFLLNVRL